MPEAARLSVVVEGDTRDLEADLKRAHGVVSQFGTTATSAMGGAAKAGTSLLSSVSALGVGVFGITQLGGAIGGLATGMVSGNAQMETYETQLGTLMGSADKAKDRLKELADFGARTPFELPEVVRAEKVLLGFGLTGEKALKLTGETAEQLRTTIGDVAAGTGASFEEIAGTFGRLSAGATGEAISRFQEMGVVTREQLTAMGIQFDKSGELISPLPKAMAAAVQIANQKFGGGMDALSKTFAGQMSTLSDNFNQAKNTVTQPIFDVLKTAVGSLNTLMSSGGFQATLKSVAETLAGLLTRGLSLAADGFGRLMTVVGPLSERVRTFFGSLLQGASLAQTVNRAFGDLIPAGLNPLLDAVDRAFSAVKTTVGGLIATIQQGGLAGLWAAVQQAMSDFAPTGERIGAAITAMVTALASLVPEPLKSFVAGLLGTAQGAEAGAGPVKVLADVVNGLSAAVAAAVGWLKENEAVLYIVGTAAAALTAALLIQQAAILVVTGLTTAWTAAQWLINAALTANPIGIVVVALGALAGALIYAYGHSETFRAVVDKTFALLQTVVTDAIKIATGLINNFGDLLDALGRTMESLQRTAATAFSQISQAVQAAWLAVSTATHTTWDGIVAYLGPLFTTLQKTIADAFEAIQAKVEEVWAAIKQAISDAMDAAKQAVSDALGAMRSGFESFRDAMSGVVGGIRTIVESGFGGMVSAAERARDTMKSILDAVTGWFNSIKSMVSSAASMAAPARGGSGSVAAQSVVERASASAFAAPTLARGAAGTASALAVSPLGGGYTTINIILPAGLMVGTAAEVARILQPELDRLVSVRRG